MGVSHPNSLDLRNTFEGAGKQNHSKNEHSRSVTSGISIKGRINSFPDFKTPPPNHYIKLQILLQFNKFLSVFQINKTWAHNLDNKYMHLEFGESLADTISSAKPKGEHGEGVDGSP